MARKPRIVPDTSVLIPVYFPETTVWQGNPFDLSGRAERLHDAIWTGRVTAYAPHVLVNEFLRVAYRKVHESGSVDTTHLENVLDQFLHLVRRHRITLVETVILAERARDVPETPEPKWPDAWFIACAKAMAAELWISHPQRDELKREAERAGVVVRTLAADARRL